MKCQHCEEPATFHITELTEPDGPKVLHLCEDHARAFLSTDGASPASALTSLLAKQLKMDKAVEELAAADKKTCPVCGITFAEFRKGGRLGCAYDYVIFEEDLQPLLVNIHGALRHAGKQPHNRRGAPERQRQLAQLREEMKVAIKKEEYEKASTLRDQIVAIENGTHPDEDSLLSEDQDLDAFQADPSSDSDSHDELDKE